MNEPTTQESPILPIYLVLDEGYLLQDEKVLIALTEFLRHLAQSDQTVRVSRLATVTFSDGITLHAALQPPSADMLPYANQFPGPTSHDALLDYLPQLIEHDLHWFKEQNTPTLRPFLMLLSASTDVLSGASTKLFDPEWKYRPNVYLLRANPEAAPSDQEILIVFAATPEVKGADPSKPIDAAANAIIDACVATNSGNPTAFRFPHVIPGWIIGQGV